MYKGKLLFALASATLLAGCATIMSGGSTQDINIQAVDSRTQQLIPDARCSVRDSSGNTYSVIGNPGVVTVNKGKGALTVTCYRPGFAQSRIAASDSFNKWVIGDVFFWPGVIVDAVTDSITAYPSHLTVLMQRG